MVLLLLNKTTNEWDIITREEKEKLSPEDKERTLYLDGFLKKKLDFGIKQQNKNNDVVGVVCGDEGSGKSSLAANVMRYISKDKFDPKLDMIGSDYEDGIDKISKVKDQGYLMFDEGNVFFLSTEIMKKEQRNLHKIFSIFRQKNLFVLIVLPSFFRLSTYFSLDRSKFLLRTYLKKGERSYFCYYGEKQKKKLYKKGKKDHNYQAHKPNFRGRFTSCYLLETDDYRRFKLKTLTSSITISKKTPKITPNKVKMHYRKEIIKANPDLTTPQLSKALLISERRVQQIKKEMYEKEIME